MFFDIEDFFYFLNWKNINLYSIYWYRIKNYIIPLNKLLNSLWYLKYLGLKMVP